MKNNRIINPGCYVVILALLIPGFIFAQNTGTRRINPATMPVAAASVWNQDMGDRVEGRPYLHVESAVVACSGGSIKSFYMTGTPLWSFEPHESVTPYLARSMEGATYACDTSGIFRTVNRVGRELWRVDFGKPISFSPVVGWDGRVFIPVGAQLSCRTAAGLSLWTQDLGSTMAVAPVLDSAGCVVTVLENRDFVRVTQFSAVEKVRLPELPHLIVSLKAGNKFSYVIFYPSGQTELIEYNESAGKGSRLTRYKFPSFQTAPASAASRGDRFAVTMRDGRVQLFNSSGSVLWTGNSHETTVEKGQASLQKNQAAMIFDERGIYSISTRGITCFTADGRRRFIHEYNEASSIPNLSDEGILYVCGKDNKLYTYKIEYKPRTVPRSKYYGPEPEGNYGMGNPPPSPWSTDSRRFDDDQQILMYARVEKAINSGNLGEDEPAYVGYMMEMIGFFLNDPHYSQARPQVKPPQRVDLIKLLGRVGSRETIPFLLTIFDRDPEPSIKAACAEAIGTIGVDPKGSTFESYRYYLAANNVHRDTQILMSATASIAAICRFSGPPIAGDGIILMRYFSNLTWAPNNIKAQIKNEVEALFREGLDKPIQ